MYFMKLTTVGAAKVAAAALPGGDPVSLTHIAVGDGNGNALGPPTGTETALVREVFRAPVANMYVNSVDSTVFMLEMTIPAVDGGWVVREVGVFDFEGDLFAVGLYPDSYKPIATSGATKEMIIVAAIKVATTSVITMVLDSTVILASRQWVLNTITAAHVLPGGLTNQLLFKKSNLPGDTEWRDLTEGVQVLVDVVQEVQTLAGAQTVVNFSTVNTDGLAVYVAGERLIVGIHYTVSGVAQITLASSYTAGTKLHAYQNDPLEAPEYLRPGLHLGDLPDKPSARRSLGVISKPVAYFMGT